MSIEKHIESIAHSIGWVSFFTCCLILHSCSHYNHPIKIIVVKEIGKDKKNQPSIEKNVKKELFNLEEWERGG